MNFINHPLMKKRIFNLILATAFLWCPVVANAEDNPALIAPPTSSSGIE
jgi:hypothetical protein